MEMASSSEDLQKPETTTASTDATQLDDTMVPDVLNHGEIETKPDFYEKEARGILEAIASTGKFWLEWEKLKAILSFQLKQVLSEYPEAKMTTEEQNASLGNTLAELMKRLTEALHNFDQGPPFTLQRLCEILLDARGIYPSLSKLALALEKNLSVTSMLTISADPDPQPTTEPNEPEKANEEAELLQPNSAPNGVEHAKGDGDEVMAEVEEADIDDNMTIDMDAFEEIVGPAETSTEPEPEPEPASNSQLSS